MKVCTECKLPKEVFYPNNNRCADCKISYQKAYSKARREQIRQYNTEYQRKRYKLDIEYKIRNNLRSRFKMALKNKTNGGKAIRNLGCSIEQLRSYLSEKFQPGMTWDNHSLKGWHIDHIKPLSSFNLLDSNEIKKACHYTNLQPLWAEDNLLKSDFHE